MQLAHYSAARIYNKLHLWLGIPAVILSVVVSTSIFSSLSTSAESGNTKWLIIIIGLLSVTSGVLAGLQTFLKYSELSEKHRIAGARYAHLKHKIELLATFSIEDEGELRDKLEQIETQWGKYREDSPNISTNQWSKIEKELTYDVHEEKYGDLAKDA